MLLLIRSAFALVALSTLLVPLVPLSGVLEPVRPRARAVPSSTAPTAPTQVAQEEIEEEARPFRIPDHAAAKSRMDRAEEHVAASRWRDALLELQEVLEEHHGDLLTAEHPRSPGGTLSLQPVHPGAGPRARELLRKLPSEARELYRERHGSEARAAFERARERLDRSALAEVARRWPLTDAAQSAWWALGDLEMERGEEDKARSAWGRALAVLLGRDDLVLARSSDWTEMERQLGSQEDSTERGGALRRVARARADLEALESGSASSMETVFADALHPFVPSPGLGGSQSVARFSGRELEGWPEPYPLPPHPFRRPDLLFPARSGDVLLVTTSLRLLALHAWSGALLWDSGEPAGWSSLSDKERGLFLKGVDQDAALVVPAAGGHVALAGLQVPLTFVQNYIYAGNIPVTTIIPDRRLFAFDLESGRALWNHEPPADWDGESGGFAQRMSIAGPPILCGTRVLAPYYRMQGRIDYHVGCFDLETGALLWSTALISGQRELNMFGRAEHEFCAPPLVAHGDRVIALTQLGTIASLDLFTGEILWETLYDQVPLPKNVHGGFKAPTRRPSWRNAPPVVAEGVVVATPFDSDAMVGIDLETGGLLWSVDHRRVELLLDGTDIDLLVGARPGAVFVAGGAVAAIAARSGLRISAPNVARWKFTDDELRDGPAWRPVLAGDRIMVPLGGSRVELDVETGRALGRETWEPERSSGNLIVGPGEMSTVSSSSVTGWFDWDLLTQKTRAALAASPDDPLRALALGRLLADRGASEWERGRIDPARTHLAEAETVLARALSSDTDPATYRTPAGVEMHRVLRSQARLRAGLADRAGAIATLRRARPLAPDKETLRDTILEEIALLRDSDALGAPDGLGAPDRDEATGRADAIAALVRDCAELPIVCILVQDEEGSGEAHPGLPRFFPVVGTVARADAVFCEMPVGLWVILDSIVNAAVARDSRSEFAGLHEILARYPDVDLLDGPASALASDRIGVLLREGRTEGYDEYEARAEKMIEAALASGNRGELSGIGRLFPHSSAARQADDHRLAWAYDTGDAAEVAKIVQSHFPSGPTAHAERALSSPGVPELPELNVRQVQALLRLSATFAKIGNRELAGELLRCLGETRGDLRSDLDGDGGRTLGELAAGIPRWTPPDPAPGIGRFGPVSRSVQKILGEWEIFGRMVPDATSPGISPTVAPDRDAAVRAPSAGRVNDGSEPLAAARVEAKSQFSRDQSLALITTVLARPAEGVDLDLGFTEVPFAIPSVAPGASATWSRRTALSAGRILLCTRDGAGAVDDEGNNAWEWTSDGIASSSLAIACASGVAVVTIDLGSGRNHLQALDAHSGVELWRTQILDPGLSPLPLLSSRHVVLLPARGRRDARVLDLFTGRETLTFALETPARATAPEDAWIEGDLLIVPWFENALDPEGNHVLAFDLRSGNRVWRVAFGDSAGAGEPDSTGAQRRSDARELSAVLQRPGRTWLLVRSPAQAGDRAASAAMFELSTRIGALSPLPNVRVGPTDRLLGLVRPGRIALSSTIAFLLGHKEGSNEARVRAVDLEGGELWSSALLPTFEELFQARVPCTRLPQPALSDTSVVLAYSVFPRQAVSSSQTTVECLDRANGKRISSFALSAAMGPCDRLKLYPLGLGLLVQGEKGLEVLR